MTHDCGCCKPHRTETPVRNATCNDAHLPTHESDPLPALDEAKKSEQCLRPSTSPCPRNSRCLRCDKSYLIVSPRRASRSTPRVRASSGRWTRTRTIYVREGTRRSRSSIDFDRSRARATPSRLFCNTLHPAARRRARARRGRARGVREARARGFRRARARAATSRPRAAATSSRRRVRVESEVSEKARVASRERERISTLVKL